MAIYRVLRAVDQYGIISDEVPVAQWIERAPPKCETAGSSPVGDASYERGFVGLHLSVSIKSRNPSPNVLLY
jgi:hypothetical protein